MTEQVDPIEAQVATWPPLSEEQTQVVRSCLGPALSEVVATKRASGQAS